MGNPTSPRVAAVGELILTVSTAEACDFDLTRPSAKNLKKSEITTLKNPSNFACQAPHLHKFFFHSEFRLATELSQTAILKEGKKSFGGSRFVPMRLKSLIPDTFRFTRLQ
jgi:hypothetical protein